jgi:hypothetical protein
MKHGKCVMGFYNGINHLPTGAGFLPSAVFHIIGYPIINGPINQP